MNNGTLGKYEVLVSRDTGFKVKFDATDKETLKVFDALTSKLFEKVEKIKVEVTTNDYE